MTRGFWDMHCFNALSPAQQVFLVKEGYLPWGWEPEGNPGCPRPAQVGVETAQDLTSGPRFYCRQCAIEYLQGQILEGLR